MTYDWGVIWQYRADFAHGAMLTIALTFVTMAIAIPAGIAVMFVRQSNLRAIAWPGTIFVEFFRNIPLILLVYWAYYALPTFLNLRMSALTTGLIALSLNVTAYNAEIFRAGVNSIRKGQFEAGLCLGMSRGQAMRKIVLPQAVRRILPMLATTWVSLFQATSLVSVITVEELAYTGETLRAQTFRVLEILTAMAVIYWVMGYPQAKLVDWIHRRYGYSE